MLKKDWFRYVLLLTIINLIYAGNIYSQTTYYIDWTNGNDSNNGTSPSSAWKSWYNIQGSKGSSFHPGDSILFKRGETWKRSDYNSLHPGSRDQGEWQPGSFIGTPGNEIVFGAYGTKIGSGMTENRPVIDSDNNTSGIDACYLNYNGSGDQNVIFRDIEFTNSVPKINGGYLMTGYSGGTVHHVTFKNCFFDATNMNTTQYPDQNETLSLDVDYLTVDSCYFYGEEPYNRHACYTGSSYARFTNNYVQGFGVSGLKFNGENCSNGIMAHNLIIDAGVNIMIGESKNADIYGNISIITSSAGGEFTYNHFRIEDNNGPSDNGMPRNNKIYNNTFIGNGNASHAIYMHRSRKSGGNYSDWDNYQDNDIQNNIFYLYNESLDYFDFMGEGVTYPIPADYNLYYSDNSYRWKNNNNTFTTLSSWRSTLNAQIGFESSSIIDDPQFIASNILNNINPNDYQLSANSPAIDAGVEVTLNNGETLTDFFGNPIVGKPDIGAFEYQSGTASLVPVANFSADDVTPFTTETVVFTDASTNSPTSWQWTFSPSNVTFMDGTSSTSRNPHVRFNSATAYTVTLRAANSAGSDNEVKNGFIKASIQVRPPVAAFSVNNLSPNTSQTVTFTDASTNSPTSWQWTFNPTNITYMDGTSSTSKNPHVKFNTAATYSCTLRVSNSAGSDQEIKSNFLSVSQEVGVLLDVSIFLSGCYTGNSMSTGLNDQNFLPTTQPFNTPPWNYEGSEVVLNGFYPGIVDWVLLELRTDVSISSRVIRRAGLVSSKGKISEVDRSGFYFKDLPSGEYYIIVHHRNHLSVMSSQKIYLSSTPVKYDFRDSQSRAYGSNAMQDLGDGNFGLYSGDGNSDGAITNDDIQDIWIPQFLNSVDGYKEGDFNMDGSVTASDNNIYWLPNNGKNVGFPN